MEQHQDPLQTAKDAIRMVAPVLGAYRSALVEAGFSESDVLYLIGELQRELIKQGLADYGGRMGKPV